LARKPGCHQRAAGQRTVGIDPRLGPAGAKAPRPFLQWQVEAVQVGAVEGGGWLVTSWVSANWCRFIGGSWIRSGLRNPVKHRSPHSQSDKTADEQIISPAHQ
jgi:hypothetical protein